MQLCTSIGREVEKGLKLEKLGSVPNSLTISPNTTLMEFTTAGVKYQKEGEAKEWTPFDTVIIASGMESENNLYQQLQTAGKSVQIAGDADDPADIYAATQNGYLTAIALG